ncbi:MAG: TadE/TadG family type IV pilus assembly protein [Alphaproteobacteria bacterium]
MPNIARSFERLSRDKAGNATIEFGFVILFMVTLGIGAYDFGNLGYQKIALTNAARAGSQYGVQDMSTAEDTAGMIQAARNDINDTADELTISARNYYFCPGQGEVADQSILCADDSYSYMYVEVTAADQVELLFPYPYVTSPQTVASTNTMRVR